MLPCGFARSKSDSPLFRLRERGGGGVRVCPERGRTERGSGMKAGKGEGGRQRRRQNPLEQSAQKLLLVVNGNDDR